METQGPGARVLRAKPFAHLLLPDAARGAVLGDFLEKIVMRVEKEGKPGREFVHCQAPLDPSLDVLDAISQRECNFLDRGRASLANVITADRDRVESRSVTRAKFEGIDH